MPHEEPRSWFIPGYAISRQILFSQIPFLLGASAEARPMYYRGREGYLVTAYGPGLTMFQIEDLKALSKQYEEQAAAKMVGKPVISQPVEFNPPGGGSGGNAGAPAASREREQKGRDGHGHGHGQSRRR